MVPRSGLTYRVGSAAVSNFATALFRRLEVCAVLDVEAATGCITDGSAVTDMRWWSMHHLSLVWQLR